MSILEEVKKRVPGAEETGLLKVFHYFEEIAAIPHGSGNTRQISDYLAAFARERDLVCHQDSAGNIIIIQEASAGYESAEPVILQGHMDMVCEKESGCAVDFTKDGLSLYVDGDFLRAEKTTLGGDDGIAVAYALAILDSPAVVHPRLEVVLTVDEETGLLGAESIDLSMLKGRRLLNIDSDVEGHFLTACAGGATVKTEIPVSFGQERGIAAELCLTGLSGGHSGAEIDKEHANAALLMGRLVDAVSRRVPVRIAELSGGLKDNAIPRECRAKLLIPTGKEEEFTRCVREQEAVFQNEYAVPDPGLRIESRTGAEQECAVLTPVSQKNVLFYLRAVPDGVQHMSRVVPGLVETSLNSGILELTGRCLSVTASVRSSVSSRKEALKERLAVLAEFPGGSVTVSGDYPAWEYRPQSQVRDTMSAVYRELYGKEPVFEAIHAGLECGILSGKIDGLDCISFGPDNYDIHTPQERLSISSTARVWELLVEFLKR